MKRNKFEATAADGKVFKRTSMNRVYTHCVVIHITESTGPDFNGGERVWPAYDRAEWAGSLRLATDNASAWAKRYPVEILEARRTA